MTPSIYFPTGCCLLNFIPDSCLDLKCIQSFFSASVGRFLSLWVIFPVPVLIVLPPPLTSPPARRLRIKLRRPKGERKLIQQLLNLSPDLLYIGTFETDLVEPHYPFFINDDGYWNVRGCELTGYYEAQVR